jgi:hypothetical protein
MRTLLCLCTTVALFGCANSAVLPLSADTIRITTAAAPVCGAIGAQNVALRRAAIETINRGFDSFIILGAASQNNVRVAGYTPVQAHTTGTAYGGFVTANTTYTGGQPILAGSHDQGMVVKMFKQGDAQGANAVSARSTLGLKWQEVVQEKTVTTC